MEQEDRKKKLAAGKEKLAAFRKKRAKKKKVEEEDSQTQSLESVQRNDNDIPDSSPAHVASLPDLNSLTVESDQYSLTSGDEWSGEESDYQTAVRYQTKLAAATQRIAELEEAVEGKQLALDRMAVEIQMSDPSSPKSTDGVLSADGESYNILKGSMSELQDAVMQRDKIIRQLTARLQETISFNSNSSGSENVDYMQETQRLSQQVVLLQQQLTQAGETVEQQVAMCQMSVQALQEAKAQILDLQGKVTEKNNFLQQMSHTLKSKTSEVTALKSREAELEHLVQTMQQQASSSQSDSQVAVQSAASRVVALEEELERLGTEHSRSLQMVTELQHQLSSTETTCQSLVIEKKEALQKIEGLEEELDELAQVRDDAMMKMSDLEHQVHEGTMLIQADSDRRSAEANERIMQLEREMEDLKDKSKMQVEQLGQRNSELEQLLHENTSSSEKDMLDLKNVINTQHGELLSLREQLQQKDDALSASKEQVASLHEHLKELENKSKDVQDDVEDASSNFQQQLQTLREENSRYKQQMTRVQEHVSAFKDSLHSIPMADQASQEGHFPMDSDNGDDLSAECGLPNQIHLLHSSYTYLITQYSLMVKENERLRAELQSDLLSDSNVEEQQDTMQHLTTEISRLEAEVQKWTSVVEEKDAEIDKLNNQLTSVMQEKQTLALQTKQKEDAIEQQTVESDTLQRKMETRISSLFSEVAEYKEALKESESANIELQDKLESVSKETESLKLQLGASEDLMKQLQNQVNSEGARVAQTEADLQVALEYKETVTQLQEQLEEKDKAVSQIQEQLQEKDSKMSLFHEQLTEKDSVVEQLQEQLHQKDSSVLQLQKHLDENIRMVSQLQGQLHEKEMAASQIQAQLEEEQKRLSQLQMAVEEKGKRESQLEEEKERAVHHPQEQISENSQQLQAVMNEREVVKEEARVQHAAQKEDSESLHQQILDAHHQLQTVLAEREQLTQYHQEEIHKLGEKFRQESIELEKLLLEKHEMQLEEKVREIELLITDRDKLTFSLKSAKDESSKQYQDLQQRLDLRNEQYQALHSEKEELEKQHVRDIEMQAQLQNHLLLKGQESEIIQVEIEQLREELQSSSSAYALGSQYLKCNLQQQTCQFDILEADYEHIQAQLFARESGNRFELRKTQQNLREKAKELEAMKTQFTEVSDDAHSKDKTIENLQSEVNKLKEQLISAEITGAEVSQNNQQAFETLHSQINSLEQELGAAKEENNILTSRLADQADMFRVKEEEMVAENNVLNHQLEEVRNDGQQTVTLLEKQNCDLQEQVNSAKEAVLCQEGEIAKLRSDLEFSRALSHTQESELVSLREADTQQKENMDYLTASNVALGQEKEHLLNNISNLEARMEDTQRELKTLQAEISQLQEDKDSQSLQFDRERLQLHGQNEALQSQCDSCASEIEQLHLAMKESEAEQEKLRTEKDRLQQQQDVMQVSYSSEIENSQLQIASKDNELQSLKTEMKDLKTQLPCQVESLQEELAAAQSEVEQKKSELVSTTEELVTARSQLECLSREKEMLKNNFDCCMEDMTQRATEQDSTIQQLQGRLVEATQNVDRDQGELKNMYELQLSELEDRLAAANLETQRLVKVCENTDSEKEKLKEKYDNQIAELELNVQEAESESSRLKEQIRKLIEKHDKETADLKQSSEIQLSSVEENCQSLEKALAKQDALMQDASSRHEREKTEREKMHEQQMSEAYEQMRMYELDCSKLKRQLDEMRKDHEKELQEVQKDLETQIFDLENKCVIASSELERLRHTLWGMEEDHSGETLSLQNKIQELEALTHNQEKQVSDLQDRLAQSSKMSDDSIDSLKELHQSELTHLEQVNCHLKEDVDNYQSRLKTMQSVHEQEMLALKQEHTESLVVAEEKCRQAESYSQVLQSHIDSASPTADSLEHVILKEEFERLQQELIAAEASTACLKKKVKETQASCQAKVSELTDKISILISDKEAYCASVQTLTEDLENEKHLLEESKMVCQDLELKNKQLVAENRSLHDHDQQPQNLDEVEGRFVLSDEIRPVHRMNQFRHVFDELQEQTASSETKIDVIKDDETISSAAEGGFEPEPDSLEYLDLAVGEKACGDYFVEESELNKSPKMRTKSVPSEMAVTTDDEQTCVSAEHRRFAMDNESNSLLHKEHESVSGRFEPEEDGRSSSPDYVSDMAPSEPVGGFQPESLPVSPATLVPAVAPNPSFLPHPMTVLPEAQTVTRSQEVIHSGTQTESVSSFNPAEDVVCSTKHVSGVAQQPQAAEVCRDTLQTAQNQIVQPENASDKEAELTQRLKSMQEQLEEQWVQKMRSQEVELRHSYECEFKEFKRQTEQQCQQQIQHVKRDTQASFVDAVRKMRKSLEKKHRQEQKQPVLKEGSTTKSRKSDTGVQEETMDENLGEIVKQLHKENKELAEVRDVLLEQIAISQTQGLRHTMQHELQAVVAGGGNLSPPQSLKLTSSSGQAQESLDRPDVTEPVVHQEQIISSQSYAVCDSKNEKADDAAQGHRVDLDSESTPTAGSDEEDDRSDGSCVRERFLEELEGMSQQSGQDLPLEWELTSTTVSHTDSAGVAGAFEQDHTGSSSVWEVFDGRCLRHDCREVRHRYNNLFHWLSRLCRLPVTPSMQGEGSCSGQVGDEVKESPRDDEDGEDQGDGWVVSSKEELDPLLLRQLQGGKGAAIETLLNSSAGSELEENEDRESGHMSEAELLVRLLSVETKKINLERRISSYEELFNQERSEFQLKVDSLQARCDDLEKSNMTLTQQLTDLEDRHRILPSEKMEEAEEKTVSNLSENSENVQDVQERCKSLEEILSNAEEEKQVIAQQLADMQTAFQTQQEENLKLQEKEAILKSQCASRDEEIEVLTKRNSTLRDSIHEHMETEEELKGKCKSLQEILSTAQEERQLVAQKLADVQTAFQTQQEENLKLQVREAVLKSQCVSWDEEIEVLKKHNSTLQDSIHKHIETEEELKGKCSSLVQQLENMCDYQEIVQKNDVLHGRCSTLEDKLETAQKDLSELHHENKNLLQENQTVNAHCRELKEAVGCLEDVEKRYKVLEEKYKVLQEKSKPSDSLDMTKHTQTSVQSRSASSHESQLLPGGASSDGHVISKSDHKVLQDKVQSSQDEIRSLQDKINVLEDSNKSLMKKISSIQERNLLMQDQVRTHDSRNEVLQADLQFTKDNLQAAEKMKNSLLNQIKALESTKEADENLREVNRTLNEKCAELADQNRSLCSELACLRETNNTRKADIKLLEDRCQALQEELREATQSGYSLREQLHEQSMTLENVITEMRKESSQECEVLEADGVKREMVEGNQLAEKVENYSSGYGAENKERLRQEVSNLKEVLTEKDELITELKEQMTVLSLQQAAVGSPPAQQETASDVQQEVQDLREEVMEKECIIQELQEQLKSLKYTHSELKRKVKEDSDLEQEVSILHQALFEKEKVIQELKETSKFLQLSQQDKSQSARGPSPSNRGSTPSTDRQERMLPEDEGKTSQLQVSEFQGKKQDIVSSRSIESIESIPVSSDPDSDIIPGQDVDIVREIGRLRKDIRRTKAVYANESALFQEALDREPVSQIGLRNSRSPTLMMELSEMTQTDVPDDPDQLKKIVVKLLDENKCLITENLRLQLRIREQEALVVEMEGRLQNVMNPPEDWQSLFERQLLLLQKQRDELQHQICERDSGVGLLSSRIGKEAIEAKTIHQQQEDLTVKIGELEHCHRLLQQRQAELAHCQAEKRHLEQILLLKDETERQLMRQKRLLEEELSTIEGKLQEREAALVEEKSRLMKELKEKDLHIFHLQSSQLGHPQHHLSGKDSGHSQLQPALMGGPRGASTPRVTNKFQSSQVYFSHPTRPQAQDTSVLQKPKEGAEGGSFLEESDTSQPDPRSCSFPLEDAKATQIPHLILGQNPGRRHSTGAAGFGRYSLAMIPKDPSEMYKFHKEAVDRLREKLRLKVEEEITELSEGQAASVSDYWQQHKEQAP